VQESGNLVALKAALRHDTIRRAIEVDGRVSIADLKERLGVTEVTIREDLKYLETAKVLTRIRGGAVVARDGGTEMPLEKTSTTNRAEKIAIGAHAASLVKNGQTIIIDVGGTTTELAKALPANLLRVVVITNGLNIALGLESHPGISVIVTGGASGIGEASARRLAVLGAKPVICDLNEEKGKAVAAELKGEFMKTDVADPDQVRRREHLLAPDRREVPAADALLRQLEAVEPLGERRVLEAALTVGDDEDVAGAAEQRRRLVQRAREGDLVVRVCDHAQDARARIRSPSPSWGPSAAERCCKPPVR